MAGNNKNEYRDLAPDILRQRLVIEGTLSSPFTAEQMTKFCNEITSELGMTHVTAPVCNYDATYGWCAYMHWKESGMHIYAWDERNPPFFSVDIYTCRSFEVSTAIKYTQNFFKNQLIELVWRE